MAKLNANVSDETLAAVDEIAKKEQRTRSQMTAILLSEAIEARNKKPPST